MWGRGLTHVLAWIGTLVLALLFVALGTFFLAFQTGPGHDFVLRTALSVAADHVNGDLEVGRIRSGGLLRGFTLEGVSIRDVEGRPFLEADSIQVGYALRDLARRRLVLRPVRIWSPRIVIETLHGDDRSNVERIFRPDPSEDVPAPVEEALPEDPSTLVLAFRGVGIVDGDLTIRLPIEGTPPERGIVEEIPGREGLYRVLRFSGMQAHIQEANVLDPDQEGEFFSVRSLALEAHVLDEPVQLADFRGEVRRRGARLDLDAERFWLPSTELAGRFALDWSDPEADLSIEVDLAADPFRLEDFRWVLADLPDGEGRFDVRATGPLDRSSWRFRSADLRVGDSRVLGAFGLDLGPDLRFVGVDVELAPLWLRELDPWLDEPLPVQGRVRGTLRADGPLTDLGVAGTWSLDDPGREIPESRLEVGGTLHLAGSPGMTELAVTVEPFRFGTLRVYDEAPPIHGEGRLRALASGRLDGRIDLTADVEHHPEGGEPATRILAEGSVTRTGDDLTLALGGELAPFSFDGVAAGLDRTFPVRGEVAGQLRLDGPLAALRVSGDLETPSGPLAGEARFDARDPGRSYRLDVAVRDFRLAELFPALPDPTTVTGSVLVDAAGLDPRDLVGTASVELEASRVGALEVEAGRVRLEARDGRLAVDGLDFRSPLVEATGSGHLALREDAEDGELTLSWEIESAEGFRAFLDEEDRIDVAALEFFDLELLRMEGVDPDTLQPPTPLEGRARGIVNLRGGLPELRGDGFVEVAEARFGPSSLGEGRVDFLGRWSRDGGWDGEVVLDLDRIVHQDQSLMHASGEVHYRPGEGGARLDLQRDERESYRVRGEFSHDAEGVEVDLEALVLEMDGEEWALEEPSRLHLRRSAVTVEGFRISHPAAAGPPLRIEADGIFDAEGISDFRVQVEGVDLERVGRMTQIERLPTGILRLDLTFRGEAMDPSVDGTFSVREFAWAGSALSRVEGTLSHRERVLTAAVEADHEGQRLLTGSGTLPLDLALHDVDNRLPEEEMEVELRLEGFPLAAALGFLEMLDQVEGTLEGEVRLAGTARSPRPSGELRVRDGALAIGDIGFRTSAIRADLTLREDQTVDVRAEARARGTLRTEGTISLAEATDPGFDLRIDLNGFQAVERRDLIVRLGGGVTLTGRYRRPRIGGSVRVEQGVLFLEEFARTAEVVDITDPAFRDVVDTTLVAVRGPVEGTENPFLRELFVEVDLTLQRDFWLRSREMNVEIAGDLIVTFDRPRRDLLLVGTLEAVRGSYVAFGRTFQVQEGTVDFVGTPGINPQLNIHAVNRVRQRPEAGGEPLNVIAGVGGTLERPTVVLSSDAEPPIPESDLISYLLFGRPSEALASGERSVLEDAALDLGIGTVATQLGAVMAREIGMDYFAITQAQAGPGVDRGGVGAAFADTQIDIGWYVDQNVFLAFMLRPLTGLGASAYNPVSGARVEWRFADFWTTEAFVEDRFARQGISGFGELGISLSKVWGLALFREWSY